MNCRRMWLGKQVLTVATFGQFGLCVCEPGELVLDILNGRAVPRMLVARCAATSKRPKTECADIPALKAWLHEKVAKEAAAA